MRVRMPLLNRVEQAKTIHVRQLIVGHDRVERRFLYPRERFVRARRNGHIPARIESRQFRFETQVACDVGSYVKNLFGGGFHQVAAADKLWPAAEVRVLSAATASSLIASGAAGAQASH